MKIIQPTNKNKILIATLAIIVLVVAVVGYAYYSKLGPFAARSNDTINLDSPTEDELKAGSQIKEQSVIPDGDKSTTGSDPAPAPQPIEGSDKKSVHAEITAANQNGATLQVRTLIQMVTSTGTCTLSMTGPEGKTYSSTAGVQALSSSSTCKGFDIPVSDLSPGVWNLSLSYESSDIIASTTKEVTIK